MNINKYTSYFHDGGIIDIKQINDEIEISMESSQLYSEWNEDNIPLSDYETIKGKLHLEGIKYILIDDFPIQFIKMMYDTGDILDFHIYENKKISLLVTWDNYPPKEKVYKSELIEIEAEKIYWKNIPDLFNPMDLSDRE